MERARTHGTALSAKVPAAALAMALVLALAMTGAPAPGFVADARAEPPESPQPQASTAADTATAAVPAPSSATTGGVVLDGTVTWTSSRSVYLLVDYGGAVAAGDTLMAGPDTRAMEPVTVRAVSAGKLVLERGFVLSAAERGATVRVRLPRPPPVADVLPAAAGGETPSGDGGVTGPALRERMASLPVRGRASMQYYRYRGNGGATVFDQPSFYMSAGYGGIMGTPLRLDLRFRSRLQRRLELPGGGAETSERRDRLYDLAIGFGDRDSSTWARFGRMRSIWTGGMGGLDGLAVARRLRNSLTGGAFGGVAPELDNFIGDREALKRGAWLDWRPSLPEGWDTGLVAAYIVGNAPGAPSTHLLYLDHVLRRGGMFTLDQEVAVNLRPHGDGREGERLQNVRSYVSVTPFPRLRLSASYNAWLTTEYRDIDRVIDPVEQLRYIHSHSFTPVVDVGVARGMRVSAETLLGRDHDGGMGLLSWALRGRVSRTPLGCSLALSQVETRSNRTDGHHTLVRLSRVIPGGLDADILGGMARYTPTGGDTATDWSLRAGLRQDILGAFHWSADVTRTSGDIVDSTTLFLEFGTRFGGRRR